MNRIHKRRLTAICLFAIGLSIAAGLILYALRQNINVFYTPHQLAEVTVQPSDHLRLGGMVKEKSVLHDKQGVGVQFVVTDFKKELTVKYDGILPDLFREGKGVVAEGSLHKDGIFYATQVLAKHDENYMPKEVYREMRDNPSLRGA